VCVLLAAGADVGAKTSECGGSQRSGWTPLRLAAAAGSVEVIRLLCDAGADVEANATWAVEKTPLMEAAERGDVKMVEALLAAGAETSRTCWGSSAGDLASAAGHTDVAALLRKM
jgi:ankyrin repeat protein